MLAKKKIVAALVVAAAVLPVVAACGPTGTSGSGMNSSQCQDADAAQGDPDGDCR